MGLLRLHSEIVAKDAELIVIAGPSDSWVRYSASEDTDWSTNPAQKAAISPCDSIGKCKFRCFVATVSGSSEYRSYYWYYHTVSILKEKTHEHLKTCLETLI